MKPYRIYQSLVLASLLAMAVSGCANRSSMRIPGDSGHFPEANSLYVATLNVPGSIVVAESSDLRSKYYGRSVDGTEWKSCRQDAGLGIGVSDIAHRYIRSEIEQSELFDGSNSQIYKLDSDIRIFCSQAKGFLFVRIAGLVGINFRFYKDDELISETYIERVVTDIDPEYSGPKVALLERAMKQTLADSLREVTSQYIKVLESELGQPNDA